MSNLRTKSSPNLIPGPSTIPNELQHDDSALEGVAAHVRLLLKLTQDHKDACEKEKNDKRRMLRVATMMTIIDNVRDRIQKCQSFGHNKEASDLQLRRCYTDRERSVPVEPLSDEKEKLKRELNASMAARKSLEIMCSSLGKEKEIMASQLSKNVRELSEMEELVSDLKAQNENLLEKVREYASYKQKEKKVEPKGSMGLQEKNKVLSEQLLRSLDGYKSMKRLVKEVQEENLLMRSAINEMGVKMEMNLERVQSFKGRVSDSSVDVEEEILVLEDMFKSFKMLVDKHSKKQGEIVKMKGEISVSKASILA